MEENKVNESLIETKAKSKKADRVFALVLCIVLLLTTALIFINKFVFLNVYVEGQSMYPTLNSGDVLFAVKGNDLKEGDIIVIDKVKTNGNGGYELLIKRAIAIGKKDKETIVEIKNGKVYVGDSDENLKELNESYLLDGTTTKPIPDAKDGKTRWELGEDEVFYLGDNREHSSDSRYAVYDVCDKEKVIAVVPEWALSLRWLSGFMYKTGQFFSGLIRG